MRSLAVIIAGALAGFVALSTLALAAPMSIETVVSTKQQIRLEFADGSNRFVAMVERQGVAEGSGPLAGTSVTEYGVHDILPGVDGDPSGYLVFSDGPDNLAYVKWLVRAVFLPGDDGKPALFDNGYWEVVGATGKFTGLQGTGAMKIVGTGTPGEVRFILDGELIEAP